MSLNILGLESQTPTTAVTIIVSDKDPLIALSNKIDWTEIFRIGESDLIKTEKGFWRLGRPISLRTHFGAYFLQAFYKWTDRQTEEALRSTPKYQVFCGEGVLLNWKTPDHTKIEKFRNRFSAETHKALGDYFIKLAVEMRFGNPSWMDIDSTVQEANMAYPADSNILKKLALKTKKVIDYLKKKGIQRFQNLEIDIKGICEKAQKYFFLSKNKKVSIKREVFEEYFNKVKNELAASIEAIKSLSIQEKKKLRWNILAAAEIVQEKASSYLLDVEYFIQNHKMKRGKILCLHLSAVACITKGKLDKVREFGRQVQIGRIGGNFLIPLSTEVKMEDKKSIVPMVANHVILFGQGCLQEIGTDKGYYSQDNITKPATMGINTDGVQRPAPIKSKPPEDVVQALRDRRAGIEPLIGHLKSFGLKKSKMKSDATTHASVYRCTMGFNIHQILRYMGAQIKTA